MKVIIERNGINAHSINDKATISHGIAQKTELSKKSGGKLEKQQNRTVGGDKTAKSDMPNGSRSVSAQKREHFSKDTPNSKGGTANAVPKATESIKSGTTHTMQKASETAKAETDNAVPKAAEIAKSGITHGKSQTAEIPTGETAHAVPKAVESSKSGFTERKLLTTKEEKTVKIAKPDMSRAAAANWKKRLKGRRLKLAPRKKYKVLNNGVVNNGTLTKRKQRVIYNKVPEKLKKMKLKRLQKRTFKIDKGKAELLQIAMGGYSNSGGGRLKKLAPATFSGTKKVYRVVRKPVEMLKQEFYSKSHKEETGISAVKFGMQTYDTLGRGTKTAVETGVKIVKKGSRLTKRVYRKLHKPTSAELKRTLKKRVFRNKLKTQANYMAKQALRKGTKTVGKAATNAAKKVAQSAYKAAQATAKAVASAVTKVVTLIIETMPWSLIVIGAILLILLISMMFGSFLGGASSSVAGGGAWLVDDNAEQTPEEIYEGYKEFIEQAKEVMEKQAKDALKNEVSSFCNSDTTEPRKIIQYIDKNNNILRYPAYGADSTINPIIDNFGTEDYADYIGYFFALFQHQIKNSCG